MLARRKCKHVCEACSRYQRLAAYRRDGMLVIQFRGRRRSSRPAPASSSLITAIKSSAPIDAAHISANWPATATAAGAADISSRSPARAPAARGAPRRAAPGSDHYPCRSPCLPQVGIPSGSGFRPIVAGDSNAVICLRAYVLTSARRARVSGRFFSFLRLRKASLRGALLGAYVKGATPIGMNFPHGVAECICQKKKLRESL
jgi:hypothetical protein